eukprot:g8209.t1
MDSRALVGVLLQVFDQWALFLEEELGLAPSPKGAAVGGVLGSLGRMASFGSGVPEAEGTSASSDQEFVNKGLDGRLERVRVTKPKTMGDLLRGNRDLLDLVPGAVVEHVLLVFDVLTQRLQGDWSAREAVCESGLVRYLVYALKMKLRSVTDLLRRCNSPTKDDEKLENDEHEEANSDGLHTQTARMAAEGDEQEEQLRLRISRNSQLTAPDAHEAASSTAPTNRLSGSSFKFSDLYKLDDSTPTGEGLDESSSEHAGELHHLHKQSFLMDSIPMDLEQDPSCQNAAELQQQPRKVLLDGQKSCANRDEAAGASRSRKSSVWSDDLMAAFGVAGSSSSAGGPHLNTAFDDDEHEEGGFCGVNRMIHEYLEEYAESATVCYGLLKECDYVLAPVRNLFLVEKILMFFNEFFRELTIFSDTAYLPAKCVADLLGLVASKTMPWNQNLLGRASSTSVVENPFEQRKLCVPFFSSDELLTSTWESCLLTVSALIMMLLDRGTLAFTSSSSYSQADFFSLSGGGAPTAVGAVGTAPAGGGPVAEDLMGGHFDPLGRGDAQYAALLGALTRATAAGQPRAGTARAGDARPAPADGQPQQAAGDENPPPLNIPAPRDVLEQEIEQLMRTYQTAAQRNRQLLRRNTSTMDSPMNNYVRVNPAEWYLTGFNDYAQPVDPAEWPAPPGNDQQNWPEGAGAGIQADAGVAQQNQAAGGGAGVTPSATRTAGTTGVRGPQAAAGAATAGTTSTQLSGSGGATVDGAQDDNAGSRANGENQDGNAAAGDRAARRARLRNLLSAPLTPGVPLSMQPGVLGSAGVAAAFHAAAATAGTGRSRRRKNSVGRPSHGRFRWFVGLAHIRRKCGGVPDRGRGKRWLGRRADRGIQSAALVLVDHRANGCSEREPAAFLGGPWPGVAAGGQPTIPPIFGAPAGPAGGAPGAGGTVVPGGNNPVAAGYLAEQNARFNIPGNRNLNLVQALDRAAAIHAAGGGLPLAGGNNNAPGARAAGGPATANTNPEITPLRPQPGLFAQTLNAGTFSSVTDVLQRAISGYAEHINQLKNNGVAVVPPPRPILPKKLPASSPGDSSITAANANANAQAQPPKPIAPSGELNLPLILQCSQLAAFLSCPRLIYADRPNLTQPFCRAVSAAHKPQICENLFQTLQALMDYALEGTSGGAAAQNTALIAGNTEAEDPFLDAETASENQSPKRVPRRIGGGGGLRGPSIEIVSRCVTKSPKVADRTIRRSKRERGGTNVVNTAGTATSRAAASKQSRQGGALGAVSDEFHDEQIELESEVSAQLASAWMLIVECLGNVCTEQGGTVTKGTLLPDAYSLRLLKVIVSVIRDGYQSNASFVKSLGPKLGQRVAHFGAALLVEYLRNAMLLPVTMHQNRPGKVQVQLLAVKVLPPERRPQGLAKPDPMLAKLFEDGCWADFSIIAGDGDEKQEFRVHRCVLYAYVPYFRGMFGPSPAYVPDSGLQRTTSQFAESMQVNFPDIPPPLMRTWIQYVYSFDTDLINSVEIASDLLRLADRFCQAILLRDCEMYLFDHLHAANVDTFLDLSVRCNANALLDVTSELALKLLPDKLQHNTIGVWWLRGHAMLTAEANCAPGFGEPGHHVKVPA